MHHLMDYLLKMVSIRISRHRVILTTLDSNPLWKTHLKNAPGTLQKDLKAASPSNVKAMKKWDLISQGLVRNKDARKGSTMKRLKNNTMIGLTATMLKNPPAIIWLRDVSDNRHSVTFLPITLRPSAVANNRKGNCGSSYWMRCMVLQKA